MVFSFHLFLLVLYLSTSALHAERDRAAGSGLARSHVSTVAGGEETRSQVRHDCGTWSVRRQRCHVASHVQHARVKVSESSAGPTDHAVPANHARDQE